MVIGVCHEIICTNCVNVEENICPKCKKSYDPDKHVATSHKLREEYGKMEEFVWADFALRYVIFDTYLNRNVYVSILFLTETDHWMNCIKPEDNQVLGKEYS